RKKPERAEPIVESDDHGTFGREVLAVIPGETARAACEASAIDPHHHRTFVVRAGRTGPDVGVEAILTSCRFARRSSGGRRRLASRGPPASAAGDGTRRARRAERVGLSPSVPLRRGLRRPPAVFAERRSSERNALEHTHRWLAAADGAREQSGVDPHLLWNHRRRSRHDGDDRNEYD